MRFGRMMERIKTVIEFKDIFPRVEVDAKICHNRSKHINEDYIEG